MELQILTGTFAASNNFDAIAQEIVSATQAVGALVGLSVIEKAESEYLTGGSSDFYNAVRMPVAVLAVLYHSRNNLVSHEDAGRKFKADENEKMPFEWMIDRDERAQRDKYYRSLDALYAFLEENRVPEWIDSYIRKNRLQSIVRSIEEFEEVYPLDHSWYVYYMCQNLVIEVGSTKVRPMIGPEKWAAIHGTTLSEDDHALLKVCQRFAILMALKTGVQRWGLEVFPLQIARRFAPTYQGNRSSRAATLEEINAYLAGLDQQLEDIREEIAELISDGQNPYDGFDPMPHNDRRNKFFSAQ